MTKYDKYDFCDSLFYRISSTSFALSFLLTFSFPVTPVQNCLHAYVGHAYVAFLSLFSSTRVAAVMWLQLTLLVPLCALVCGQPWTRMDVQYDALSPRQNYRWGCVRWSRRLVGVEPADSVVHRVVCPKSFAVNRDDPDEAHPFWMAQPKLLHVFHSAKPRPAHDVALVTHLNADRWV